MGGLGSGRQRGVAAGRCGRFLGVSGLSNDCVGGSISAPESGALWQTIWVAAGTLYDLLGVPATSTTEEIRSAYRKLSKVHHPDLGGTADFFRRLHQGYELLTDPIRRAAYDQFLAMSANYVLPEKEESGSREPEQKGPFVRAPYSPRQRTAADPHNSVGGLTPEDRRLLAMWSRSVESIAEAGRARRYDVFSATWAIFVTVTAVVVAVLLEATHGIVLLLFVILALFAWRRHESSKRKAERRERAAKAAAELNRTAREAAERRRATHAAQTSRPETTNIAARIRENPLTLRFTDPTRMAGGRDEEVSVQKTPTLRHDKEVLTSLSDLLTSLSDRCQKNSSTS
jgi:curved DNA-binding protein CbpA